jgi:hypothetical protein
MTKQSRQDAARTARERRLAEALRANLKRRKHRAAQDGGATAEAGSAAGRRSGNAALPDID